MLRKFTLGVIVLALAACSGPRLPFEKEGALGSGDGALVRPPWEALVEAGPGADQELDLETLNGPSSPPVIAADVSPPPSAPPPANASDKTTASAEPEPASPPSKSKGKDAVVIASVAVPSVTGAKGTGNADLTRAMRAVLKEAGWPVVGARSNDALTIEGRVKQGPVAGDSQEVKLVWVVMTPDGKILGNVAQANDVPASSLDAGWGENARFAAEAAADGIFKLIEKYR